MCPSSVVLLSGTGGRSRERSLPAVPASLSPTAGSPCSRRGGGSPRETGHEIAGISGGEGYCPAGHDCSNRSDAHIYYNSCRTAEHSSN